MTAALRLVLAFVVSTLAFVRSQDAFKVGRCPTLIDVNPETCANTSSDCATDANCHDLTKCCNDGCRNVCTLAVFSACEHQFVATKKRARALETALDPIACRPDGHFESVQCDLSGSQCWCVDESGFEIAGTRGNKSSKIDCSSPRRCSNVMCRMLCAHGFALDSDGCPMCQCRDPCSGVKCPGNQECHLEDVSCDSEPCPQIPSCKQARLLDTICPSGEPLFLNEKSQPYLCGIEENKPQCPPFFSCVVKEQMEYGACCPSLDNFEKPGKCPAKESNDTECGTSCTEDSSCMGLLKCCESKSCGSHCVASNSTMCEQQRMLAELLSRNEKSDRGYVPQCDENGGFEAKQCSRNGLVCWCVDIKGNKLPKSMGPAQNVSCAADLPASSECHDVICNSFCEYGNKVDENGCPTCDCADPCDGFPCAEGEMCITSFSETCIGTFCPSVPECQAAAERGQKSGICPELKETCVNDSAICVHDEDCKNNKKCCMHACGSSCISPIRPQSRLPTMCEYLRAYALRVADSPVRHHLAYSTPECTASGLFEPVQCSDGMCWCVDEFGVELSATRAKSKEDVDCSTAQSRGSCLGLMCRLGCEYGFVREDGCPVCKCLNPCDVFRCPDSMRCQMIDVEMSCNGGFCPPIPQCVAKSKSVSECSIGNSLLNPETNDTWLCTSDLDCPSNYSCQSTDKEAFGICCSKIGADTCKLPKDIGPCDAIMERWFYNSDTSRCELFVFGGCGGNSNNFAKREDCEEVCVVNQDSPPKLGLCPSVSNDEMGKCADECKNDEECPGPQKCCMNGCGAHVCRDPAGTSGKVGQCPYLIPTTSQNCDLQCTSDYDCEESSKCCSNGCGTSCIQPMLGSACEHLKAIGEYVAREKGIPAKQMYIASCQDDGSFEPVQCVNNQTCWCVDETGKEISGTRVMGRPNCTAPRECPMLKCLTSCEHGVKRNEDGCPTCACQDPCSDYSCDESEECRLVKVQCMTEPCDPIPMCLPKLVNPCPNGEPYRDTETGEVVRCGPQGSSCPSSHKCHLSPFGEFAVCCRKTYEACLQTQNPGHCYAAIPRWSFHAATNTCQEFVYGGCGGNLNNFQTLADCRATCPVTSSCERLRDKNKKLLQANKNLFIPKCNGITGAWQPTQCLPSLGLCWCVNRDGEQQPGSLVRGVAHCSARMGRTFGDVILSSVCDEGKSVHECNPNLCANKLCLGQSEAICRVDPCGGCVAKFYNSSGHEVDCNEGLTSCQLEMQSVVNSARWADEDSALPINVFSDKILREKREDKEEASTLKDDYEMETNITFTTMPETLPELPQEALLLGAIVPQCTNKGAYSPTQTNGVLSWCVTPDGQPIHDTLSRGSIECSPTGEVVVREESLEVCPNGRWKPRVCKEECVEAYCPANPEAVCMADPCNNCKTSFYNKRGEIVSCERKIQPKCIQPMINGPCKASFLRYFYEESSQQCKEFIYGGCDGNDNNFPTLEECHDQCEQPKLDVCEQPKRIGMCRASMHRWYFNQVRHRCEAFIYGGCDGNDNNFETKEECEARCPDLVLCPTMNFLDVQTPCSRRKSCSDITCPGREDIVCTVDPCNNCSKIFVDLDGNRVPCESSTETTTTDDDSWTELPDDGPDIESIKKTRCQKEQMMSRAWGKRVPTCDANGRFEPMQCQFGMNVVEEMCWCVDEAGNNLPDSLSFQKGTRVCKPRTIEFIRVKLVFQFDQSQMLENQTELLKEAFSDLLEKLEANAAEDIIVEVQPDSVSFSFILIGDDKVDVAFTLEELLKYGLMRLVVGQEVLSAIPTSSWFYHELSDSHPTDRSFFLSATTVAVIFIFITLTLLLVACLIGGVMLYRKRRMGIYPRGSLLSLASSTSPLYAYETKTAVEPHFTPLSSHKNSHISTVENDYAILNVPSQKDQKSSIA